MRVVMFYHSLVSDWNHGNAHFLRGVASVLIARGHDVRIFEPANGWSSANLTRDHGSCAMEVFQRAYPTLYSTRYELDAIDLDRALEGADLVLVHEWNPPELVARLGQVRRRMRRLKLLFHDTHHRLITDPHAMARFDLRDYDGVLAFGEVLREMYLRRGLCERAWTWHEAADTRLFRPQPEISRSGDLVFVGNWGDEERSAELQEFLVAPVAELGLRACVHGVRYPDHARATLQRAGIEYRGFLPNPQVPEVFAAFRCTVHVPRRPYAQQLPGIPTIRVFEALACGIPLVCSPWTDSEGLFTPGKDFLCARSGAEMTAQLRALREEPELGRELAEHGLRTIEARHTCEHRVDELLAITEPLVRNVA
jgi:spore maturation protein CgeB